MAKIIRMVSDYEKQRIHNIKMMNLLVNKLNIHNKAKVIKKIKNEQ